MSVNLLHRDQEAYRPRIDVILIGTLATDTQQAKESDNLEFQLKCKYYLRYTPALPHLALSLSPGFTHAILRLQVSCVPN